MPTLSTDQSHEDESPMALLHEDRGMYHGAFSPPVYRSSTFGQKTLQQIQSPDVMKPPNYIYSRVANPTTRVFEEMLAQIEHGEDAVAFGSGMGAITAVLLAFLGHGDHVLCVENVYHPARDFLDQLAPRMNLTIEAYRPGDDLEPLIRPNTRLIYTESPTSHHFEVLDLRAISRVARAHNIVTVIDNTWATPIYQTPLDMGIDISLHSVTKYIGGHSDLVAGVAVTSHKLMETLRPMAITLGATLSPEDSFLAIRGLRTLAIRMPHHMASGLEVAAWLRDHPLVAAVRHPGLPDSPYYELGRSQMSGCSGLFGVTLKPIAETLSQRANETFVNALALFGIAPSWGGFESLIVPSDLTLGKPPAFRLSIGFEPPTLLIADLEQALACYGEVLAGDLPRPPSPSP